MWHYTSWIWTVPTAELPPVINTLSPVLTCPTDFTARTAVAAPIGSVATSSGGLFRVLSGRRSQIEFPTVEVDGVDEVLLIAETARRGLDPLNP